ncbi:MAG: hypothetical protein HOV83_38985, partial [Catenulispora sp.]|nr:hypothetical protein [Catenulispora sp.]
MISRQAKASPSAALPVHTGGRGGRRAVVPVLFALLMLVLAGFAPVHAVTPAPSAGSGPTVTVDPQKPKVGDTVQFKGTGWTPGSLVQVSLCGQLGIGGSNTCAQAASTSVTIGAEGALTGKIRVVAPPKPCPCVLRAVTVTGGTAAQNTGIEIDGAPTAALPQNALTPGRLVFMDSWMAGEDTIFTWFGSPVTRRFQISVANMGQTAITNPKFRIGTYEGVFAPRWRDVEWNGTIAPGAKAVISLDIELKARQHGHFVYRVMYNDQVVDERALDVKRPWGVYLFMALLVVVVPLTAWRLGMSVFDAIRNARKERAIERDREVGLPASLSEKVGKKAAKAADEPAPEPALVGASVPLRKVEETMVVGAPLFADRESALPTPAAEDPPTRVLGDGGAERPAAAPS